MLLPYAMKLQPNNVQFFRTSVDMVYGKDAEIRNWSVMDFITLQGLPVEKLEGAREIRDSIKDNVSEFLLEIL